MNYKIDIKYNEPKLRRIESDFLGNPAIEFIRGSTNFGTETISCWRVSNDVSQITFLCSRSNQPTQILEMILTADFVTATGKSSNIIYVTIKRRKDISEY